MFLRAKMLLFQWLIVIILFRLRLCHFTGRRSSRKLRFTREFLFEDNLFMTQILLKARRVGIINEKLYKRRIRSGSIMHNDAHDYIRRFASHFVIAEELRKPLGDCSNHVYEALESIYSRFVALFQWMIIVNCFSGIKLIFLI